MKKKSHGGTGIEELRERLEEFIRNLDKMKQDSSTDSSDKLMAFIAKELPKLNEAVQNYVSTKPTTPPVAVAPPPHAGPLAGHPVGSPAAVTPPPVAAATPPADPDLGVINLMNQVFAKTNNQAVLEKAIGDLKKAISNPEHNADKVQELTRELAFKEDELKKLEQRTNLEAEIQQLEKEMKMPANQPRKDELSKNLEIKKNQLKELKGGKSKKRSSKSKRGGSYNLPAMSNTDGLISDNNDPIATASVHVGTLVNTPSPFSSGMNTDFNDSTRTISSAIIDNVVPPVGVRSGGRAKPKSTKRA